MSKVRTIFILGLILINSNSCIDANKRNLEQESIAEMTLTDRTVEFSNIPSNAPSIINSKVEFLVKAQDNNFWSDAYDILSADELNKLNSYIAELNNPDTIASFAASRNLINAKNESIKMLISQVNSFKTDEAKVNYLTTLRRCIKIPLPTDERDTLSLILQNFAKESSQEGKPSFSPLNFAATKNDFRSSPKGLKSKNLTSQEVKIKALTIWVEIASEDELPSLAEHLDVHNSSVRSRIYQRLSKAKSINVLNILAKHLNSDNIEVRSYAVNLLRLLTGQYFGYNPVGEPISRQLAICRWVAYILKGFAVKSSER